MTQNKAFTGGSLVSRWSDPVDKLKDAVQATGQLSTDLQGKVGGHLNKLIDRQILARRVPSLGLHEDTPMVLKLHQGDYFRRRWYDQQPKLRRAFNMMVVLPPEILTEFSGRVIQVYEHYFQFQQSKGLIDPEYKPGQFLLTPRSQHLMEQNFLEEVDDLLKIKDSSLYFKAS